MKVLKDRRRGDRRRSARPVNPPPLQESWFGVIGVTADAAQDEDQLLDDVGDSKLEPGWSAANPQQADSQFLSRQARRLITAGYNTFQRIHRAFLAARAALGICLIVALGASGYFGSRPTLTTSVISSAYALMALTAWLWLRWERPSAPEGNVDPRADHLYKLSRRQWLATIGVDVVCFSALHLLSPVATFNYAAMLVLPVLMAGVLMPRLDAMATAATVTLSLLMVAWFAAVAAGTGSTNLIAQAGLTGIGLFVIAILAGELAGRLAREELTAKGSLELARQQAQLNRLMIEEMQDGVLVLDRKGRVRAANPAARRLLAPTGMCTPAPFRMRGVPEWDRLMSLLDQALLDGVSNDEGSDVALTFGGGVRRTLRVRIRFTKRTGSAVNEELCVLLLEDVRSMQARSRQEKLAAMGRISAGIAHEIRNPLAAISQANALLSEDATSAQQRQLTKMVSENVDRLKRIVDDVMEVAPGGRPQASAIELTGVVGAVCSEWAKSAGLPEGESSPLKVELSPTPLGAIFDDEHLRRVIVNLLDNAYRHASKQPGSVNVHLDKHGLQGVQLLVGSDGPPIAPDVEPHLFEPFFSTRSRGTGLGLYICRELCERYGASIDYRRRQTLQGERNEFFVRMRQHPVAGLDPVVMSADTSSKAIDS
jgi:two-component system sensor histidine kinase PilS (NtrC family)